MLYLSHYFRRHRQAYYDLLQSIRDRGQWGSLAKFLPAWSIGGKRAGDRTARRILTLREGHRNLITDNLGYSPGNGHRVLEHLYERPIISVNEIRDLTGTTYAAANQLPLVPILGTCYTGS